MDALQLENKAQLLEDARQVHAQGALEGTDSPPFGHVCVLGERRGVLQQVLFVAVQGNSAHLLIMS